MSVQNAQSCAELQRYLARTEAAIENGLAQIASNSAALAALQSLLQGPAANPTAIVQWIESFISAYIGVDVANLEKLIAQQSALQSELTTLLGEIQAAATKFENCIL